MGRPGTYEQGHTPWSKGRFLGLDHRSQRFGRLVAIQRVKASSNRTSRWLCQCDCGKTTVVRGDHLRSGRSRSCGCLSVEVFVARTKRKRMPAERKALRMVLFGYRRRAEENGTEWGLTDDQARILMSANCHYCGLPPTQFYTYKFDGESRKFHYNGIDRVNSLGGYTTDSTVSCCKQCNFAKGALSLSEFLAWVSRIHAHQTEHHL